MFPNENYHYKKNIRIIGGIDLNPEKFTSEYNKRYYDRGSAENLKKNAPYYLTALAARKYSKYMEMVHGQERSKSLKISTDTRPIDEDPK